MRRVSSHLSVLVLVGLGPVALAGQNPAGATRHSATFNIVLRGVNIGFESVTVTQHPGGWLISSTGQLAAPIDLTTSKFEVAYAHDWHPQRLTVEATTRGRALTLSVTFGQTLATVELTRGVERGTLVQQVTPHTIVLPNSFYAGYEALASRLASLPVGTRQPVYVAPEVEVALTVDAVTTRRFTGASGSIEVRQYNVTFANRNGPLAAEIWVDPNGHLARLFVPSQALAVIREDLASVATREQRVRLPGDEEVFVPATGFNLGATLTRPAAAGRRPAVVLVGGQTSDDRDEAVGSVPVFGRLAALLSEAGIAAVRYDRRGSGLSGGRTENATLETYAEDALHVIQWLRTRKDIDADRLAMIGYGEGGAPALLASGREKRISALVLAASPGRIGRQVVLEQQAIDLARLDLSPAERAARVDLQRQIVDAVTMGVGWDRVPQSLRRDVDTPFFKSWLLFDPATVMPKLGQPILIVHGALDRQVPPDHADRLEAIAKGRTRLSPVFTRKVVAPGVNHLLVEATSGEIEEYGDLLSKPVAPEIASAITSWLTETWARKR